MMLRMTSFFRHVCAQSLAGGKRRLAKGDAMQQSVVGSHNCYPSPLPRFENMCLRSGEFSSSSLVALFFNVRRNDIRGTGICKSNSSHLLRPRRYFFQGVWTTILNELPQGPLRGPLSHKLSMAIWRPARLLVRVLAHFATTLISVTKIKRAGRRTVRPAQQTSSGSYLSKCLKVICSSDMLAKQSEAIHAQSRGFLKKRDNASLSCLSAFPKQSRVYSWKLHRWVRDEGNAHKCFFLISAAKSGIWDMSRVTVNAIKKTSRRRVSRERCFAVNERMRSRQRDCYPKKMSRAIWHGLQMKMMVLHATAVRA